MMAIHSALDVIRHARSLLAAFLVLSPVVFWYGLLEPFESCKSTLSQMVALALLALAVAASQGRSWAWCWGQLRRLYAGPIGVAVLVGVGAACVSTALSISPRTSLQGAMDSSAGLGTVLAFAVIFAASRAVCHDGGQARQLLAATAVGAAIACGYALIQALGCDPVAWDGASAFSGWVRPSGTQGHPNYLAGHIVMTMPLIVWLLLDVGDRRQWGRIVAVSGVILLAGTAILASLSRAAWLASLAVFLVLFLARFAELPRRWGFVLFLVLTVGFAGVSIPDSRLKAAVIERIRQQGASAGRRVIWKEAWANFLRHPWVGSGVDTFRLDYAKHRSPEYWEVEWGMMPTRAHNDFLHALATQGVTGGVAYLMLPGAMLLVAWKRRRTDQDRPWLSTLLAVIASFYVQNLFGFSVASTSGLLAVVAGALAAPIREQEVEEDVSGGVLFGTGAGIGLVLAGLWQGTAIGQEWRFAAAAAAIVGAGFLGLVAGGVSLHPSRIFNRRYLSWQSLGSCRPLFAPGIAAVVVACFLVVPLVSSSLSYQAERATDVAPETALALHARAVRLAPGHGVFHARRANALMRAAALQSDPARRDQLLRESASAHTTACHLQPLDAAFHADRAKALLELARLKLADRKEVLAAFDLALSLDRCHWGVLADAARAATTLGFFDEAERYVTEGLARQPRLGMLLAERGALELARGRLADAEVTLWKSGQMEWHGDFERYDRGQLLLSLVFLQRGKAAESLHTTGLVLKRHADWVPAWWLHALARERLGQKAAALREYHRVLAQQPDHPQARASVERLSRQ